jgi:3-oxoacyl-[acyl-carrier-protein] synthase III
MAQSAIVGSGTCIPQNKVTNEMLSRIMDTPDDWIRERCGVECRYYASPETATSDLGAGAARGALEMAGMSAADIDMVVFATMTPDHFFPGSGGILQAKLGLNEVPCFELRQQCTGFLYGLQLANAHIRAGMAQSVLLVGAEVHTGFMPWTTSNGEFMYGRSPVPPTAEEFSWNTRFRHLTVLFGDGAGAVVLKSVPEGGSCVVDSILHTDGRHYEKLCVPGVGFKHRPYVDAEQLRRGEHIPIMDGRLVFKKATTAMTAVTREILARNGLTVPDLSLVLMHQANMRINEYVQKTLDIPSEKVIHNIQKYGNTTAGTIPLLWDEAMRLGRIRQGDLVLMVAFGAGLNWGAALVRA